MRRAHGSGGYWPPIRPSDWRGLARPLLGCLVPIMAGLTEGLERAREERHLVALVRGDVVNDRGRLDPACF